MATELSEVQKKFLDECEKEFVDRFTEKDKEFTVHCERPVNPPPILDDWMKRDYNRRHHNNYYQQHQRQPYQYSNYNSRRDR